MDERRERLGIQKLKKCLNPECEKPRAAPLEYCVPHFGEALDDYYIAALKAGVPMPAWSNDDGMPDREEPVKPRRKKRK
jgi:hypothetical protein